MIYGPFSLADATAAHLSFRFWLNSAGTYDRILWMASTDGVRFHGYLRWGDSTGWLEGELDLTDVPHLGDLTGQSNVWLAFEFRSDSGGNSAEGAYVDDIVVRKFVSHSGAVHPQQDPGRNARQPAARPGTLPVMPVHRVVPQRQ